MSTAKTANGLPYPNPDDPVRDGAQRIRELAEALDRRGHGLRVEARTVAVTPNGAGGFAFAFARPFAAPPQVSLLSTGATTDGVLALAAAAGGIDGAICGGFARLLPGGGPFTAGAFYISYIAIGPDPNV